MFKTVIVSPSGNFYGSEQVLYNFLNNSTKTYEVYVPFDSVFSNKLMSINGHKISTFKSVKLLYLKLFFKFLLGNYHSFYLNEGGHIKYAKVLAGFFKDIQFFVHIRLVEDTAANRIGELPSNLRLLSISNYISGFLNGYRFIEFYDPLDVLAITESETQPKPTAFRVGVIGRVSRTKGLKYYDQFFEFIGNSPFEHPVSFQFYGDVPLEDSESARFFKRWKDQTDVQIEFKGFVFDQSLIYQGIQMVIHLNPSEPLGRVGLESWARGIPFVGFDEGGVGEINRRLAMDSYSIALNSNWPSVLKEKIELVMTKMDENDSATAKDGVSNYFGISKYVCTLEDLLSNRN
jgi:glycosyltransferase involved in cell wall biosynthesis